ncbi:MAG: hydrogenobyrinic acid a,c-diamide synthase (glutamine-hydrolyzing) [Proteobacteria bacterium]|nr:hydrogenobyrinic acid a,c-diamide synthase (glutamine-hydrolyzing) [Pseudomonadota bacterium]
MAAIYLSATKKSSGKTTCSIGLCGALSRKGIEVQPFKKGPDYIDPMWLSKASGSPCYNLDFHTMSHEEIQGFYQEKRQDSDIAVIEGNKGLYDGLALDGHDSNGEMVKLLGAPIIIIADVRGTTRGIAPHLLGYQAFDRDLNIAGVILNYVAGERHEMKLRNVIKEYTDIQVLGAIPVDDNIEITQRHLGLTPSNETSRGEKIVQQIVSRFEDSVDIDGIIKIAEAGDGEKLNRRSKGNTVQFRKRWKIGIARDRAFGFYYQDDLDFFRDSGVDLISIDLLHDHELPVLDGLFIGGGFPETQMKSLSDNKSMLRSVASAINSGLPTYAECGGLMYLSRSIQWQEKRHEMVGIIQADSVMHQKPVGKGYVALQETEHFPWPSRIKQENSVIHAHEFHYSTLTNWNESPHFAYSMLRGTGISNKEDGYVYKNLLACYTHQRNTESHSWGEQFVRFIEDVQEV